MNRLRAYLLRLMHTGPQRGDVPGWVLVTVMTAGLVAALYTIADDQLRALLTSALNKVS
ncbi:hypothetical protein [Nocardioides sp. Kera G14]|uniref:hypothetical protein n=1 Tax=Nocardioides sp. Kera G14 TaxID=2884264 RepID=UPI001D1239F1|nr:hypothetical protein [Nocardioides sp. Kera G14]UDY22810.1 hypothetical protein LH076_12125 [Nocardioides sp. Kera G14]